MNKSIADNAWYHSNAKTCREDDCVWCVIILAKIAALYPRNNMCCVTLLSQLVLVKTVGGVISNNYEHFVYRNLKEYKKNWCTVTWLHFSTSYFYPTPYTVDQMTTIGGLSCYEIILGQSFKSYNSYQNLMYCNLETICAIPNHGLTVHQASMWSIEKKQVRKSLKKLNNSMKFRVL